MNPIPIIGFSTLSIIALHLAYKFGARKANERISEEILTELHIANSLLNIIEANTAGLSSIFVKHLSDLASKPKTAKPRKTTRLKN